MYKIGEGLKIAEEDNFEHGCLPNTGFMMDINITFSGDTIEEAIKELKDFYCVDSDSVDLNACGEAGRIDISVMENGDSYKPTNEEIELWKQGKINLYHAIYTHHIYKMESIEI